MGFVAIERNKGVAKIKEEVENKGRAIRKITKGTFYI